MYGQGHNAGDRGKIGKAEEVETDEIGGCIGSFARIRIRIDITQPLKKRLLLSAKVRR